MKKLKYLLITIIVTNHFSCGFANDIDRYLKFANNLFAEKKYEYALKEYLRVYYIDKENKMPEVCDKISDCFLILFDYENALKYQDIYFFKLKSNEAAKNEVRYKKQKIYLLSNNYKKGLVEILQVNKYSNFNSDRHNFLLGLNYLMTNDFEKGKITFSKLSYYSSLDTIYMNKAFAALKKNDKKNPKNARWLSSIIPGLGQFANGEIKDGLNSLGLFIGFITLWIDVSKSIGPGDATLSVGPWFMRYYLGGLNNSITAAKNKKAENKLNRVSELISIFEKGKLN